MTTGDPFEDDAPCDAMDCAIKQTCARWVVRCALTWITVDGETHVIGLPWHNRRPIPPNGKCRYWLAIPNDKYPPNDVYTPRS